MITKEQAEQIRKDNAQFMAWVDTQRGRNGWASYKPSDVPAGIPQPTNEQRSALEVYDFVTDPPEKYFLYIDEQKKIATTWTGECLGNVLFGREFESPAFGGFPSKRVPITLYAINHATYYGTYFKSSGSYARVKMSAGCRRILKSNAA